MAIKLQGLETDLKINTSQWNKSVLGAIAVGATLAAGIGIAAKATFDWANDLDSLGDVMDGTSDGMAAMAFVARKSGVGVDALAKSGAFLNKGLLKQNGTLDVLGKKLKDYGISVKDANGNVKDSVQLTDEIARKYADLSTVQERVNFLTDVYGKSGAQLVDFFDTLVAEGGIDKVTEKVKAFGLAIDPARYEQFNRNLEEMKLVGLGLAVQFTENLMPSLEKLTDWLMKKGIPGFTEFRKNIDSAFKAEGISGVVKLFWQTLKTEWDKIDWTQLDIDIAEFLDGLDTEALGASLASLLDSSFSSGVDNETFDETTGAILRAIDRFFRGAFGEVAWQNYSDFVNNGIALSVSEGLSDSASSTSHSIGDWIEDRTHDFVNFITGIFLPKVKESGGKAGQEMPVAISTGFNQKVSEFWRTLITFEQKLEVKLRDIGKTFFNRALGWTQQAKKGFENGINAVLSAIEFIVEEINGILKKIKTHFSITFSFSTQSTGVSSTSNLGHGSGGGCFIAGTKIWLSDKSTKNIEDIECGDEVLSWHNGSFIPAQVTKVFHHEPKDAPVLVRINDKLVATPEHLIFANGDWKPAGNLMIGDILLGDEVIETLEQIDGNVPVYNLHTDHESHNYIANGVLVHNAKSANADIMDTGTFIPTRSAGFEPTGSREVTLSRKSIIDLATELGRTIPANLVKAMNNA